MRSALLRAATLLGALAAVTFSIAEWVPGDYLSVMRADPTLSAVTIEAMTERSGLDRPWWVRFGQWCVSAVQFDFGLSLSYGVPVRRLIAERLPATLVINLVSTVAAWIAALILGALAARDPSGWADKAVGLLQAILTAIPEIILALAALWLFGGGSILPYAVLTLGSLPMLTVHARASLASALSNGAVRSARLHGITGWQLWSRYVLPIAAPPLITLAGLSVGGLLSASLLVEAAFEVPGLGTLLRDAIQSRDTPVIAAVTALSGAALVTANLAAEFARRALDPRTAAR